MVVNICNGLLNYGGPIITISDSMSDEDMENIYEDNFDNSEDYSSSGYDEGYVCALLSFF